MFTRWSGRVPTDAATPGCSSSRHNPIHKQELGTGDGDWLSERRRLCVAKDRAMKGEKRGIFETQGHTWIWEAAVASGAKLLHPSLRHPLPLSPPPRLPQSHHPITPGHPRLTFTQTAMLFSAHEVKEKDKKPHLIINLFSPSGL